MANYVFGIDVGGTSVKCGLFQTDGTLLEKWEIPTRTENGGSEILPDIAKSVKAKMAEKGIAADDVAGVGIDVPGPVNDKGELSIAVNLNWGYKNIVKELSDELGGMAVKAANDANAAALGEMWAGGSYTLTGITRNGQPLRDDDTVTVTCLAAENQMEALLASESGRSLDGDTWVKNRWRDHLSGGGAALAEPENYMTLR